MLFVIYEGGLCFKYSKPRVAEQQIACALLKETFTYYNMSRTLWGNHDSTH